MAQAAPQITPHWYEETCHRLDNLQKGSIEYYDEGDILPPTELYGKVKRSLLTIGELAGFPQLDTPDVCLGPDGQIVITFSDTKELELLYTTSKLIARLIAGTEHQLIDPSMVPITLKQLAA